MMGQSIVQDQLRHAFNLEDQASRDHLLRGTTTNLGLSPSTSESDSFQNFR